MAVSEMDDDVREHLGEIEGMAMRLCHKQASDLGQECMWHLLREDQKNRWREQATLEWRAKLNPAHGRKASPAGQALIAEEDELVRRAVLSLETIAGLAVKLANPPMIVGADGKVERLGGMLSVEDPTVLGRIASALERLADVYAPRPVAYPVVDEPGDETGETPMPGWKSARGL